MFGANLVVPAQICDELSSGQGKVYGLMNGQTDRLWQQQYPFGLKGQGVKTENWFLEMILFSPLTAVSPHIWHDQEYQTPVTITIFLVNVKHCINGWPYEITQWFFSIQWGYIKIHHLNFRIVLGTQQKNLRSTLMVASLHRLPWKALTWDYIFMRM